METKLEKTMNYLSKTELHSFTINKGDERNKFYSWTHPETKNVFLIKTKFNQDGKLIRFSYKDLTLFVEKTTMNEKQIKHIIKRALFPLYMKAESVRNNNPTINKLTDKEILDLLILTETKGKRMWEEGMWMDCIQIDK